MYQRDYRGASIAAAKGTKRNRNRLWPCGQEEKGALGRQSHVSLAKMRSNAAAANRKNITSHSSAFKKKEKKSPAHGKTSVVEQ